MSLITACCHTVLMKIVNLALLPQLQTSVIVLKQFLLHTVIRSRSKFVSEKVIIIIIKFI